jgi:hypothetical protein
VVVQHGNDTFTTKINHNHNSSSSGDPSKSPTTHKMTPQE